MPFIATAFIDVRALSQGLVVARGSTGRSAARAIRRLAPTRLNGSLCREV